MTAVGDPPAQFSMGAPAAAEPSPETVDEERFRETLIVALKRDGYGRLCRDEKDPDPTVWGELRVAALQLVTQRAVRIAAWMVPGFAVVRLLGGEFLAYAAVALIAMAIGTWTVPSTAAQIRKRWERPLWRALSSDGVLLALLFLFPVLVILEAVLSGLEGIAVVALLPLGLVVALGALYAFLRELGRIRGRVPRLERGAALVFPIVVVALFVQLFTTEVWAAADHVRVRHLIILAGLTVLPLLVLLLVRLRSSVPEAFTKVATRLAEDTRSESAAVLQAEVWKVIGKDSEPSDTANGLLTQALDGSSVQRRAQAIRPHVKDSFDVPLGIALVPMVLGIWLLMALYVYALAWVTVDVTLAADWIGRPIRMITIGEVALPGDPYPVIAAFLGVVATAVFLALALTEDAYKDTLTEGAIQIPVRHCLLIAIPYLFLLVRHDRRRFALRLAEGSTSYDDDNTAATMEDDDADRRGASSGHSLWYRWTATDSEWFAFQASSQDFEPLVTVYERDGESPIAESAHGLPARFRAIPNAEYDISVDGRRGGRGYGAFTLAWAEAPGPANETLMAAEAIEALTGSVEGDTSFATTHEAERLLARLESEGALWYRWTAPEDTTMQFSAGGADIATSIVVLRYTRASTIDLVAATPASDPQPSRLEVPASEGETFLIAVETLRGRRGRIRLDWTVAPERPANDHFADAETIAGSTGRVVGSTAHATREILEPLHADKNGSRSIWYRWTAREHAWMHFSTEGSSFDTLLAVYTGSDLDALEVVAANDDALGRLQSLVRFESRVGEQYHIAVDGYAGSNGDVTLSWSPVPPPPANVRFAAPVDLDGIEGEVTADTTLADHEPGEPHHAGLQGGKSVWYRWKAPEDGWMQFSTEGSDYDTLLAVYLGDSLTELATVATNDDVASGVTTSLVRFNARRHEVYRIAVDGHSGASGGLRLTWRPGSSPPANDDFVDARDLVGLASPCMVSNVHATREDGEPLHADRSGGASVWFRWHTDRSRWFEFSTADSTFDTLLAAYVGGSVETLHTVAAHDDVSPTDRTSRIGFKAQAGTEYRIAVDGYDGAAGDIILSWERIPYHRAVRYWWANRRYR